MNLQSLPLFPLDTVLYPDGLLSLQVLELRYQDMMDRCHRTGAPFGVVLLTDAFTVTTGTLARITEWEAPQPGRLSLQCIGVQRFAIDRRDKLKHGLWIADVTLLAPDLSVPIPADLHGTAEALRRVLSSLQARDTRHTGGAMPVAPPYRLDDCAWVSNRWCELLPIPPDLKQRLLALDNPLLRLELVSDILERTGIAS